MRTITSRDGTTIAFDQAGQGPALILVGGAFEQRAMDSETAKLAAFPLLTEHFTVYHYDRRGRGDSGDHADTRLSPVARETEDIEALIDAAGGSAYLFGISSGGGLALEAALTLGDKVRKLAIYEVPYNDDADARQAWIDYRKRLDALLAESRKDDAVILFMTLLGMPEEHAAGMREMPMWPMLSGVAATLAYDAAALGADAAVPAARAAQLRIPTLLMDGGATDFPFMHRTALALANAIPNAQHRTLDGQTHEVTAEALAPVLVEFFRA